MSTIRRSAQLAGDKQLIAGLEKHFSKGSLRFAGSNHTSKEIVAQLLARVAAAEAVLPVKAELATLVAAENAEIAKTQDVIAALVDYLHTTFGGDSVTLSDFGLAPRKRSGRGKGRKTKRANAASPAPTDPSTSNGASPVNVTAPHP